MKRIRVIDSYQGSGGTRVQDQAWQRLLQLDNGYFQNVDDTYDFYTNDGLLIRGKKNSDDFFAKRFASSKNELFVDYCEPGLGYSVIEENILNPKEFLFRDTGFYSDSGNSFFIKLQLFDSDYPNNIPDVWNFQAKYSLSNLEILKTFLLNSVFVKPKLGEILFRRDDNSDKIILNYVGSYYRKLTVQMSDYFKKGLLKEDTGWHSIYYSLKSATLVKDNEGFSDFV